MSIFSICKWADDWTDALTNGCLLGTFYVRKSSQEGKVPNISQIEIFQKFKVAKKGPFVSTDGLMDSLSVKPRPSKKAVMHSGG